MPVRAFLVRWAILFALGLVAGIVVWQAFGWFSSFLRVAISALVWSFLIALWLVVRTRWR
jgi:hypothetical protein